VLVTVDSLRADAVAAMPTLRGLAREGTSVENAFAHGNWTPFSFPSLLGGEPVFAEGPRVGPSSAPTLAEALRSAGVETAGFNAANGFLTEHWGYNRGFETFETFLRSRGRIGSFLATHPTVQGWAQLAAAPVRHLGGRLAGSDRPHAVDTSHLIGVERRARSFLEAAEPPFFLWIHYMDTHTPYVPAPRHVRAVTGGRVGTLGLLRGQIRAGLGREVGEGTREALRALYDAAARQVDESLGRLLGTVEASPNDVTVVVAGDHGEEFMEHGHLAHYPKLYEELIHVPLVISHPGAPARTVERAVGLDAVPPTVCGALDVPAPPEFAGESLLPAVRGGDRNGSDGRSPTDPVVSVAVRGDSVTQQPIPRRLDEGDPILSARTAEWSYIRSRAADTHELYHRTGDPTEQRDRWADRPADAPVDALRTAVRRRLDRLEAVRDGDGAGAGGDDPEPDGAIARRLDALGYR